MPHVINGIGTWYYGRSRVHRIKAGCEFCNRIGDLTSYDTTLYFVVLFIPVIPLSKKRVIDECPSCRRHRVVSWKDWEKQKQQGIGSVLEQLANNPNDHDALGDALGIVTMYQDEELFERIADLAKADTEIPKIQLQLGQAYSYFGRREEAETAYQNALRNDDSPPIRKAAALNALRMGEPERAEELVDYVLKDRVPEDISFVMLIIDAYQSFGRHDEALALMDKRDEAFPELKDDKTLLKQRKQSEKHLGTGKRLNTANLVDSNRAKAGGSNSRLPKLIFPLLLLAAAAIYIGSAFWIGGNQNVYLVNGTNKPYHVTVNGKDYNLSPMRETKVRVEEGAVEVVPVDSPFEPVNATVKSNFWTRPFSSPIFVINPDRVAILVEEEMTYSKNPRPNPPPTFSMGESFYQFKSTDYNFQDFPASIRVKGNSEITKHRVGVEHPITSIASVSYALSPNRKGASPEEALKRLCISAPDEVIFLSIYLSKQTPEQSIAFLKTGLAVKPRRVEWHRLYQSLVEQHVPKKDLVAEYRALLKDSDGNDGDAKYLLARILPDGEEADRLMQESIETNPPSAYGNYALGFRALAQADFPTALKFARKAKEIKPNQVQFQKLLTDALWASGDYKEYIEAIRMRNTQSINLINPDEFRAAAATNNRELMTSIRGMKSTIPGQPNPYSSSFFDMTEAIVNCDVSGYLELATKELKNNPNEGKSSDIKFYVALLQKRLDDAERVIQDEAGQKYLGNTSVEHGLLALAAYKGGQIPMAKKHVAVFAEKSSFHSQTDRKMGDMLTGKEKFDVKFALQASLQAEQKRIALAILAYQNPDQKEPLLKLVRELDFQKDIVSLVLNQMRE